MPRAKGSEGQKKTLLRELCDTAGEETPRKVIRFPNEDVPQFLEQLSRFEQRSRKTRRMIGGIPLPRCFVKASGTQPGRSPELASHFGGPANRSLNGVTYCISMG